jgi:hypothetical protein
MRKLLAPKWNSIVKHPLARSWLWIIVREQKLFEAAKVPFALFRRLIEISVDCRIVVFIALSKWTKRFGRHIHPGYGFIPLAWVNFFNGTEKPDFFFRIIECNSHHYDNDVCIWCAQINPNPKALKEKEFYCVCGFLESECQCQVCVHCKRVTKALVRQINDDGDSEDEDGCNCILCDGCDACLNDDPAHTKDCTTHDCKCNDVCPDCGYEDEECACSSV